MFIADKVCIIKQKHHESETSFEENVMCVHLKSTFLHQGFIGGREKDLRSLSDEANLYNQVS